MSAQATVATGKWLDPEAAASYKRMRAGGCPAGITSAGRTHAEQAQLRADYLAHKPGAAFALPPGNSKHELGLALDLPEPARAWVRKHGAQYGWVKDVNPAEPWHMEYVATRDKSKPDPTRAAPKEDTVLIIRKKSGSAKDRRYALVTGDRATEISIASYSNLKKAGHAAVQLTDADYDKVVRTLTSEKG